MAKAVSDIGGNPPDILRALKVLLFISSEWDPTRDTAEGFAKDLTDLGFIPAENVAEAQKFLVALFGEIQKDNLRRLQKTFANSLLPSFTGVSSLIDFRAVFDQPYRFGSELESYQPRCVGFVPVVLVRLRRDGSEFKTFEFQCEPRDLELLISHLQAALKELGSAKNSLPGGVK